MELTRYEKPMAIEQLLFKVRPDMVQKFLELDNEIWTKKLATYPGYVSKEVWVSQTVPGDIITMIYWSDIKLWEAIDQNELVEVDRRFYEAMGEGTFKFYKALHEENQFFKISEYK